MILKNAHVIVLIMVFVIMEFVNASLVILENPAKNYNVLIYVAEMVYVRMMEHANAMKASMEKIVQIDSLFMEFLDPMVAQFVTVDGLEITAK